MVSKKTRVRASLQQTEPAPCTEPAATNVSEAETNLEISATIEDIYQAAKDARPKNTQKSYDSRIQEYLEWCTTQNFPAGTE